VLWEGIPEWWWVVKLNRDTTEVATYTFDSGNTAGASESFHIWTVISIDLWQTKAGS